MICPYCKKEIPHDKYGTHEPYISSICKNHGDVDVGILLNIETHEIDFKYFQIDTPQKQYTLYIRDKFGTTTLVSQGKKMTLANQTETIVKIDSVLDLTPEEFPFRLKTWLMFS